MSYGIYAPCKACAKETTCSDLPRIRDAVSDIHNSGIGHKGYGMIAILCNGLEPVAEINTQNTLSNAAAAPVSV